MGFKAQNWYDGSGELTLQLQGVASGQTQTQAWGFDGAGNQTFFTDGDGNTTLDYYDSNDRQTLEVAPGQEMTQTAYDPDNDPIEQIDPVGNVVATAFDRGDNAWLTELFDSGKHLISYSTDLINSQGEDTGGRDALYDPTQYKYSPAQNQTQMLQWDSVGHLIDETSASYDKANNETWSMDGEGNVTSYTYDGNDNLLSEVVYDSHTSLVSSMGYSYDGDGNVATETDGAGNVTSYSYDGDNNVLTQKVYVGGVVSCALTNTYNADEELASTTDGDGNVTSFSYNGFQDVTYEVGVQHRQARLIIR